MENVQSPVRAKKINYDQCAVPNCGSRAQQNTELRFYQFPLPGKGTVKVVNFFGKTEKNAGSLKVKEWTKVTKVRNITKNTKVCSLHFKEDDYILANKESKRKCLKKTAIPSCALPKRSCTARDTEASKARVQRLLTRNEKKTPCTKSKEVIVSSNADHNYFSAGANENHVVDQVSSDKTGVGFELESDTEPSRAILKRRLDRNERETPAKKSKEVVEKINVSDSHCNNQRDGNYVDDEMPNQEIGVGADPVGPIGDVDFVGEMPLGTEHVFEICPFSSVESEVTVSNDQLNKESDAFPESENYVCETAGDETIPPKLDVLSTEDSILRPDAHVAGKQKESLCNFTSSLKTNAHLSTVTGIETFAILDTIVECVKLVTDNRYEKPHMRMKTRDRVIMTYMKLKMNQSYSFLAIIFNCYSDRHCQRIFLETLKVLSAVMKVAIRWPSQEEISKNLPLCFVGFEDVRIVLDCTEVFIQVPCNLCCQRLAYSHYKGSYTAKFMTGVTAGGLISFVSKMYGGKTSDTEIFNQSKLKDLLEKNDAVMVDKGFHIDKACEINQWKLIRPPFRQRGKGQFSRKESDSTYDIASARVHVERFNQRIKVIQILGSRFPIALISSLPDVFNIVCGTINLSSPIFKDDKFMIAHGCSPE